MAVIDYAFLRRAVAFLIQSDPAATTFYSTGGETWGTTGRLAPSGSRTFGRLGQSLQLAGTELVGTQLHILVVPYDTRQPGVGDEVRTVRSGVLQRFSVVTVVPSPWKVEVILDESR